MPFRPLPAGLPSERTAEIANRLNSVAIHLLRRISRDDGADGLTRARASALSVLLYGGPTTITGLARKERVATPTITRIVDGLVRGGLVRREVAAGDRRAVTLTVTPRGRRLVERGRARRIRRLSAELKSLDRRELDALERAIEILGRLEKAGETRG